MNQASNASILVVEDSRTQAEQLGFLLEQHGYRVSIANSGEQALEQLRASKFSLIISDIVMPGMSGYELCKTIKSDEQLHDIPIILVTKLVDLQDVILGLESGADNFIHKPYDEGYLLSRIDYLLINQVLHRNQREQQSGVVIRLSGRKYFITSKRQQILDLLISTYEQAIHINDDLKRREHELAQSNDVLQGLYRIADGLNRVSSEQEVAETALERAMELPGVQSGWIFLRQEDAGFHLAASHNLPPALAAEGAMAGVCACQRRVATGGLESTVDIVECERLDHADGETCRLRYHASVPLWVYDRVIGVLNLAGPDEGLFDEEALKVLYSVGNQVALALERARLHEGLEQLVQQRTAALTREIEERKRIEQAQSRLAAIIEANPDYVGTATADGRSLYVNRAGRRMRGLPEDSGMLPEHIRDHYPEWAAKILFETAFPAAIERGSWMGQLALLGKDGQEIPVQEVILAHKDNAGEVEYFSTIARDITQQLEQEKRILRMNRVYALLSGINTTIVRTHDRDTLFRESCRIAVEYGKFSLAWIGLLDDAGKRITPVSYSSQPGESPEHLNLMDKTDELDAQGLCWSALRNKTWCASDDIDHDPRMAPWRDVAARVDCHSSIALPLLINDEVIGVFCLFAGEKNFFDVEEIKLLMEVAGDISFALDHIEKEKRANYLAYYDQLTDLANSALFLEHLSQFVHVARENATRLAVVVVDLDHFRLINESFGRDAGDHLLRQTVERLIAAGLQRQHLARISADAFALVMDNIENASDVALMLDHELLVQFNQPFKIGDKELLVSAKAGIALFPDDGTDADQLFRNAEAALKNAKSGGSKYQFYTPEINASVAENLTLESNLRQALEQAQFELHYQPKISLKDGRIVGLEALIRWNEPGRGLVLPARFISLLEESGMILDVGRWVLEKAVSDASHWLDEGLLPPRIAVNVSQVQLRQPDFVRVVEQVLRHSDGAHKFLCLEITESLIMHDIESNFEKLQQIREMGVKLSVDDFGTGYSSLSYIAKLPVDELKIDRAFIINMTEGPDDLSIVSTIISLAHALNLSVVAEGVETKAQAELLRLLKCDTIQGFLFSPAVPAEAIGDFLRENKSLLM